ncbi:MAG TPA: type II toxin-antitoxin system VapC family toxin [Ottowia sp.]|nr:type II toxin-antitoxin system VapC family toxin [Ottowia sp.]
MSPQLHVAEPPAPYLARPALVIDCSVLAGLVFREHWYEAARDQVHGSTPHAPHLLIYEISNVALKKHRRQEAHALPGLAHALTLDIELHEVDMAQTFALAQRYQLSAYDASYLWLAGALRCPLATFDETLAQAAQQHLGALG